jgi:hypothetical protein
MPGKKKLERVVRLSAGRHILFAAPLLYLFGQNFNYFSLAPYQKI